MASNFGKCAGCRKTIKSGKFLICHECHLKYDIECVNITSQRYNGFDPERKRNWKCPECCCKTPKTGNTNTPIRPNGPPDTSERSNSRSPSPQSNVTFRKPIQPQSEESTPINMEPAGEKSIPSDDPQSLPTWYHKLESSLRSMIVDNKEEILNSLNFLSNQYDDMQALIMSYKKDISDLKRENSELKTTVADLSSRVSLLENHTRECNVEVTCIPETRNECITSTIIQLSNAVSYSLQENDIVTCKRVAKINPSDQRPRAVIVKLRTTDQRDNLLAAVTSFNKTNPQDKLSTKHIGVSGSPSPIYISEHMSPAMKHLHAQTRRVAKDKSYKFVWVRNGRIRVRKDENSRPILILRAIDLEKL